MTTVNALIAAMTAIAPQSCMPPSAVSASHLASPVRDDAVPSDVTAPIIISVSQPVAFCTSFQVKRPTPGRNIAQAPRMLIMKMSSAGTHVLEIHSTTSTDMNPITFRSLVLNGPSARRSRLMSSSTPIVLISGG